MELVCFTAWMLGYPWILWITKGEDYETRYDLSVRGTASLVAVFIWVFVGGLIWSKVP